MLRDKRFDGKPEFTYVGREDDAQTSQPHTTYSDGGKIYYGDDVFTGYIFNSDVISYRK